MSTARIIRALLNVADAAHRAFTNGEPLRDASRTHVVNDFDFLALNVSITGLMSSVAGGADPDAPLPLRAELALRPLLQMLEAHEPLERMTSMRPDQAAAAASQVAPASALPSRPDYWNIDTAGAQYDALARQGAGNEPPSGAGGGNGR